MRIFGCCIPLISLFICINWRSPEPSEQVNFYGSLITHQNNEFKVNHIAFGTNRKIKQIAMYEKPHISILTQKKTHNEDEEETVAVALNPNEIQLQANPQTDLAIKYIDLHEIKAIGVPSPEKIWWHQKKKGYRKVEYVEITVTSKDPTQLLASYIIEKKTELYCDAINNIGPEEMRVPIVAIQQLTIAGCYFKPENNKTATGCQVEPKNNNK